MIGVRLRETAENYPVDATRLCRDLGGDSADRNARGEVGGETIDAG